MSNLLILLRISVPWSENFSVVERAFSAVGKLLATESVEGNVLNGVRFVPEDNNDIIFN